MVEADIVIGEFCAALDRNKMYQELYCILLELGLYNFDTRA